MKFRIFGGVHHEYHGIYEYANEKIANEDAYQLALKDLESYVGYHGYPHPDNYEDPENEDYIEEESERWDAWLEDAENWISYKALPVEEGVEYDSEGNPRED